MWRLFYPLRYFRLLNNEKRMLDFWPTLLLALVIAAPFWMFQDAAFFRTGGFLDKLILLTSALTGFYVAALVAAATFPSADLDKVITVGTIALLTRDSDGKRVQEALSRREFVCTLFGYLAFAALFISLASGLAIPLSEVPIKGALSFVFDKHAIFIPVRLIIRDGMLFVFALAIAHLCVATSLGLYYLMDRIYRRDPKILTKKNAA